jgi:hypothetical protein
MTAIVLTNLYYSVSPFEELLSFSIFSQNLIFFVKSLLSLKVSKEAAIEMSEMSKSRPFWGFNLDDILSSWAQYYKPFCAI